MLPIFNWIYVWNWLTDIWWGFNPVLSLNTDIWGSWQWKNSILLSLCWICFIYVFIRISFQVFLRLLLPAPHSGYPHNTFGTCRAIFPDPFPETQNRNQFNPAIFLGYVAGKFWNVRVLITLNVFKLLQNTWKRNAEMRKRHWIMETFGNIQRRWIYFARHDYNWVWQSNNYSHVKWDPAWKTNYC